MTIKLDLNHLLPDDAKTMTIANLTALLNEFGFTVKNRLNRSTFGEIFAPFWYRDLYGKETDLEDMRLIAQRIITFWNAPENQIDPEPEPTFYDDAISPAFGSTSNGTIEMLALTEPTTEAQVIRPEPTDQTEWKTVYLHVGAARRQSRESLQRQTEAQQTPDDQSVESSSESVEIAPLANLGAFSPMAIGAITATVKVLNTTGKFEILESSSVADLPVGKNGNSTVIAQKELGSVWSITCHLTDKGSIKIDSISEPTNAASSPAPIPSSSPVVASSSPAPLASSPVVGSVNAPLIADIDQWECPDYYISPDAKTAFKFAYKLLQKQSHSAIKILMTGESGYGKTTIAERFAAFVGFDCFRMNCATIRDTEEWFFDREVKTVITNGVPSPETVFTISEFAQRIARGNCVIVLDEFNRLESNLHNSLFPLLDDAGKTTIHHIDFTVGENVIFVATVNLGAKFVGTFLLDDALTNRFDLIVEVKPMPFDHECTILTARYGTPEPDAESIVKMATILRENEFSCSTRDTLKIAKLASVGMTIRDGFEYVVVRRIPEDESNAPMRKSLCDLINKSLGTRGIEFSFTA